MKKFTDSMKKIAAASGENGIKRLSGNGVKIGSKTFQYEIKVKGAYGDWRVLGNYDTASGHYIFNYFTKGLH